MTFTLEDFYNLYLQEIVWLHGVPVFIVSNQDPRFTTHFLKSFQRVMGTQLLMMSTVFHPHKNRQSERTIDRPKTRCVKCVPNYASARVASSNIVY